MTEDVNDGADPIFNAQNESSASFSTSREEYIFTEDDDDEQARFRPSLNQLNSYPSDIDYYAVLGLPRSPPPSDAQIRSAFRLLSPNFHPDKHPRAQQQAREIFEKLEDAYEVLIDPQKRAVYDLLGHEGMRKEWDLYGTMGIHGPNREQMVGIRAMDAEEFKSWFLDTMRKRERQILESMVENRVCEYCPSHLSLSFRPRFEDASGCIRLTCFFERPISHSA
jgi:DnaJ family protein C protein 11